MRDAARLPGTAPPLRGRKVNADWDPIRPRYDPTSPTRGRAQRPTSPSPTNRNPHPEPDDR